MALKHEVEVRQRGMAAAPFSGPARDYLPKPDNGPAYIEPGKFAAPDEVMVKRFRLGVEIAKRRILDADRKAGAQ